jgi:hypothetical protein
MQINHIIRIKLGVHVTDVLTERADFQFCCARWDSYFTASVQVRSKPNGIKLKMWEHKLKNGVNCKEALKQKGIKQELRVLQNC